MKIKNYLVIAAASLGLSLIYSNQVQADEMPPTNQQSVNNNLSQTDINELDKYVSVENNTFVLNVPENSNISSEKVQMARQEIESVNNSIKNNNLLIDPETKEIVQYNPYTMFVQGAFNIKPGLQAKWFWWGQQSYYSSNAVVAYTVNKYRNYNDVLGLISHVTKYKIATFGSLYYQGVAWQLESYNNAHRNSKIYMDINWVYVPSFGKW